MTGGRACFSQTNWIESVSRALLLHIWTFLEITSWKIELPQVSLQWAAAARSVDVKGTFYQSNLKVQTSLLQETVQKSSQIFVAHRRPDYPVNPAFSVYATPGFGFKKATAFSKDSGAWRVCPLMLRGTRPIQSTRCANCFERCYPSAIAVIRDAGLEPAVWAWLIETGIVTLDGSGYYFVFLCPNCMKAQPSCRPSPISGSKFVLSSFVVVQGVDLLLAHGVHDFS